MDLFGIFNSVMQTPLARGAINRANDARDAALGAQESVLSALNVSNADDVARLSKQVRALSQRLDRLEDALDSLSRQWSPAKYQKLVDQVEELRTQVKP